MKIVINWSYGGFGISDEALEMLNTDDVWAYDDKRTDEKLIALIEKKGSEFVSGECSDLIIVEIPDNATDWEIEEYDGSESVIYVVDGKIYHE